MYERKGENQGKVETYFINHVKELAFKHGVMNKVVFGIDQWRTGWNNTNVSKGRSLTSYYKGIQIRKDTDPKQDNGSVDREK